MVVSLNSKGQVTIPRAVREHLGIGPGNRVNFRRTADGGIMFEKAGGPPRQLSRFAKVRGSAGPGMTTDELMALLRGKAE